MSSVRLDNYVYTEEALAAARKVMAPDGRLIMYHMSPRPYIAAKIFQLLSGAFDEPPQVFYWPRPTLFNYAFLAGGWGEFDWRQLEFPEQMTASVDLPTDNWPYLYLARRTLPRHYIQALAVVLVFSTILLLAAGGRRLVQSTDLEMFLLGVGFLLLETKSVTEMSLLFGSTWQVNLLVFSAILSVILIANWLVETRVRVPLRPVLIALLVSLALGYVFPVRILAGSGQWLEWLIGGTVVALPILFASLVFATLFKSRTDPVRSLGYNLLGAAVGGVLEYSVMLFGIKTLYLVAGLAYALVLLSIVRFKAPVSVPAD